MHRNAMTAFIERLARDEALLARLRDRIGDRRGDQAILAMIDLAVQNGFEIWFAEARALLGRAGTENTGQYHEAGRNSGPARDILPEGLVDLMRRW